MVATDPLLIGIDVGTTRVRALAFTARGGLLAEASRPTPWQEPAPGLAELDPEALVDATVAALAELARRLDRPQRVAGLAVASVGESGVLLDAADRPLAPALAWYDPRPAALRAELLARVPAELLARIAGVTADPILGVSKLLWHARHTPEAFEAARRWLHLADWLAFRLGGAPATDATLASRTGLFDLARARWSEELLEAAGIPSALLPEILPTGTRIGGLSAPVAAATGLPAGCAIGVAGYDHAMAMLAADVLDPSCVLDSMGTAEGLALPLEAPVLDGRLAACGFNQGLALFDRPLAFVLTGLATSAAAIDRAHALLAPNASHAALIAAASAVPPGAQGLLFVPHLRFPTPPSSLPEARGLLLGLAPETDAASVFRAVLEGVALDWQNLLEHVCERIGRSLPEKIRAVGGSSRNPLLLAIKASLARRPIEAAETPEAVARGAARAAGRAARLYPSLEAAGAALRLPFARIEPDPAWPADAARRHLARYRALLGLLAPVQRLLREARTEAGEAGVLLSDRSATDRSGNDRPGR
ncbi:MAG: FGGY family carbohydrate kinase [Geminicoccaceae bacterium]|nr:FGGY family carbohydrate kinase [Geminicoccaceae bacterium]